VAIQRRDVRWVDRENGVKRFERTRALERMPPAEHFVEHHAKSKQIGAPVDPLAFDLLRSHVARGPGDNAGHRVAGRGRLIVDR
jgi:hypothetical protein